MVKYLFFIVATVLSFKIDLERYTDPTRYANLQSCASVEIDTATKAIAACDQPDQLNSTECIVKYMNSTIKEYWDVWIKSISQNDGLNYWTWNSCNVTFTNYGKYNRTFVLWTAKNYSYVEDNNFKLISKESKLIRGAKTNNSCTDWEVWSAYYYINQCDSSVSTSSATCLYNYMFGKLNQKWNVWVNQDVDKSALSFFSNGCQVEVDNYGKYNKNYLLWQA